MSVAFFRLKPGMRLFQIHRDKTSTAVKPPLVCREILIISVDEEERSAMCSTNGHPPKKYYDAWFRKLYQAPTSAYLRQQAQAQSKSGDAP